MSAVSINAIFNAYRMKNSTLQWYLKLNLIKSITNQRRKNYKSCSI